MIKNQHYWTKFKTDYKMSHVIKKTLKFVRVQAMDHQVVEVVQVIQILVQMKRNVQVENKKENKFKKLKEN